MKTTTISELKHNTAMVLSWVAGGESVEVRRRNERVAILAPPGRKRRIARPDFEARLRLIYGSEVLATTATELLAESLGNS